MSKFLLDDSIGLAFETDEPIGEEEATLAILEIMSQDMADDGELSPEAEAAIDDILASLPGSHSSFSEADSGKDVALGGPDGRKVETLLSTSIAAGTKTLSDLTRAAVTRLLERGPGAVQKAKRLFTDEEQQELADQLAAVNSTAFLLGAGRIAERADEAERRARKRRDFAEFCGGKGGTKGPCPTGGSSGSGSNPTPAQVEKIKSKGLSLEKPANVPALNTPEFDAADKAIRDAVGDQATVTYPGPYLSFRGDSNWLAVTSVDEKGDTKTHIPIMLPKGADGHWEVGQTTNSSKTYKLPADAKPADVALAVRASLPRRDGKLQITRDEGFRLAEMGKQVREARKKKRHGFADFCGGKGGTPGPCPQGGGDVPGSHNPAEIEVASPAADKAIGDSYSGLTEVSQSAGESFEEIVHSDAKPAEKVDEIYAQHDEIALQAEDHMDRAADDTLGSLHEEYLPEDEGDLEDYEGDWSTIEEEFRTEAGAAKQEFLGVLGAQRDAAEEYALDGTPEALVKVQDTQDAVDKAADTWMGRVRGAAQKAIQSVAGVYNNNTAGQRARYSTEPTRFSAFDEGVPLQPMPPLQALDYFRRLYPKLGVDPERWGPLMERGAFTAAAAADERTLTKIQDVISEILETGQGVSEGPELIDEILDRAGVSETRLGYSTMLVRTNVMDSFNTGGFRQLKESEDMFPCYEYANPDDGRSRPHHAARNGKFYPSSVPFVEVRGTGIEDAANDRCTFIPVSRYEWADLVKAGARLETGPPW